MLDNETPESAQMTVEPPTPAPPALPERWRLRDLLFFILYIPVALIIASVVTDAAYAALKPLAGWTTPIRGMQTNVVFLLALQAVFYLFLLGFIYFLVAVHYREGFWRGLQWLQINAHNVLRFILGGIVISFLVMFTPQFIPERKHFPLEKMFSSPASAYAVAIFAVALAPFVEELIFRGLLFKFFEKHGGLKFAIITTAILFAGLHVPEYWGAWDHVVMIFIVGLIFSIARGMTGSVTPSYVLHAAYNATLMLAVFFQTQHFHKIPGFLHF